jgi:hypothetical protein
MKLPAYVLLALFVTLLAGCTMIDGVFVKVQPGSFEELKKELIPFLIAKDFTQEAPVSPSNLTFARPRPGLYANFYSDGKDFHFFVGKAPSKFSPAEISFLDECAALLTRHPEFIVSGSLSKDATSESARERFYAHIKKA